MKVAALVLYAVAFLMQMAGAYVVVQDVRTSIRNMRQLKDDLTEAEASADEHRRQIAKLRSKPRGYGLQQAMERLTDTLGEAAVDQTGPAQAVQRRALVKYVTAQNDISNGKRWTAVWLLLLGLLVGFAGNVVSSWPF
jgi:hypothetical protein